MRIRILIFFYADANPDADPGYQKNDADPCGSGSTTLPFGAAGSIHPHLHFKLSIAGLSSGCGGRWRRTWSRTRVFPAWWASAAARTTISSIPPPTSPPSLPPPSDLHLSIRCAVRGKIVLRHTKGIVSRDVMGPFLAWSFRSGFISGWFLNFSEASLILYGNKHIFSV
jgi:hypothetical protein